MSAALLASMLLIKLQNWYD